MLTKSRILLALLALGLALTVAAGCGGDDDSDGGGGEPTIAATTGGGVSTPDAEPTDPPRATSEPDDGDFPTFEDGAWTAGEATVTISGTDNRTLTLPLVSRSTTEDGRTRLVYDDDIDTIDMTLQTQNNRFDMIITQVNTSYFLKVPFDAEPCTVTYAEASETSIKGTFRCDGEIEGEEGGPAVMEGTFTATR